MKRWLKLVISEWRLSIGRRQSDLLRDPAQQMRYGYTSGNPLSWVDPLGLAELVFVYDAKKEHLSELTISVLADAADVAEIDKIYITETKRTPDRQAETMYKYIQAEGVEKTYALYSTNGDKVVSAYVAATEAELSKDETIDKMVEKINEVGPEKISSHMKDFNEIQVVDVADNLIPDDKRKAFEEALSSDERISKYLGPNTVPRDRAHHIEIPQEVDCE